MAKLKPFGQFNFTDVVVVAFVFSTQIGFSFCLISCTIWRRVSPGGIRIPTLILTSSTETVEKTRAFVFHTFDSKRKRNFNEIDSLQNVVKIKIGT